MYGWPVVVDMMEVISPRVDMTVMVINQPII